jgi:hypothetical protein
VYDADVDIIAAIINREGGEPGNSIHGWRCEYPERYGPCDCVRTIAEEIVKTFKGTSSDRPSVSGIPEQTPSIYGEAG